MVLVVFWDGVETLAAKKAVVEMVVLEKYGKDVRGGL